jgi:hypothetical protein
MLSATLNANVSAKAQGIANAQAKTALKTDGSRHREFSWSFGEFRSDYAEIFDLVKRGLGLQDNTTEYYGPILALWDRYSRNEIATNSKVLESFRGLILAREYVEKTENTATASTSAAAAYNMGYVAGQVDAQSLAEARSASYFAQRQFDTLLTANLRLTPLPTAHEIRASWLNAPIDTRVRYEDGANAVSFSELGDTYVAVDFGPLWIDKAASVSGMIDVRLDNTSADLFSGVVVSFAAPNQTVYLGNGVYRTFVRMTPKKSAFSGGAYDDGELVPFAFTLAYHNKVTLGGDKAGSIELARTYRGQLRVANDLPAVPAAAVIDAKGLIKLAVAASEPATKLDVSALSCVPSDKPATFTDLTPMGAPTSVAGAGVVTTTFEYTAAASLLKSGLLSCTARGVASFKKGGTTYKRELTWKLGMPREVVSGVKPEGSSAAVVAVTPATLLNALENTDATVGGATPASSLVEALKTNPDYALQELVDALGQAPDPSSGVIFLTPADIAALPLKQSFREEAAEAVKE